MSIILSVLLHRALKTLSDTASRPDIIVHCIYGRRAGSDSIMASCVAVKLVVGWFILSAVLYFVAFLVNFDVFLVRYEIQSYMPHKALSLDNLELKIIEIAENFPYLVS